MLPGAMLSASSVPAFLAGGGTAGAVLRALDWDGTGLGRPEDWAPALRSAVALCLHAAVPIAVFWGPELRFIFGDAWLPLLGARAGTAMARPGRDVWPDIWPVIEPGIREAVAGTGVGAQEVAVPLLAPGGGSAGETWWSTSFSPVLDSSGRRLGVLATVSDVTDQVLNRRRQAAILELADRFAQMHDVDAIVRLGCEVIGRTLNADRVVRAIVDEDGGAAVLGGTWLGPEGALPRVDGTVELSRFWAEWTTGREEHAAVAVDDVRSDPRTRAGAGAFLRAGVGAFMTAPLLEAAPWQDGRVQMVTLVQSAAPRHWRDADLAFLRDVVSRGRGAAARARVEAALRESDTRNRHSVELSPLYMWTADEAGRIRHLDERMLARIGHHACSRVGWVEVLHPEDKAHSAAAWDEAVATGGRYDVEHRVLVEGDDTHGPGYRWMRSRATAHRDAAGRIIAWYGSSEDIDDARRAAAALAASEARLRAVTDSVDQMIWSTLPDGWHDYFNQTWYEYTGVVPGTSDGDGWVELFHPDDRQRTWETWTRSLRTGEPYRIEYRLRHRSGVFRWVLGRAHPVRDSAGRIERWYGTCTDIQEITDAREVLARSRAELERLAADTAADRERMWRLSSELMAILRPDGTVTAVNPAWERVLGWPAGELVGRPLQHLVHPDDRARTVTALRRLRRGSPVKPEEQRMMGRDGAWRVLSWTAVPEGGVIHAIGRDTTAEHDAAFRLEAAQDSLRQAQKMEAVGQLTGGIAHDFNNMLAVVMGSLDMLRRRLDPGDARAGRYVDAALEGARRAAALTRGLLAFSRQQKLSPVVLDLAELLDGMTEWLRSSLGALVRLEVEHGSELWPVLADRNQLENAVLNLAVNARDAMPEGGVLRLQTANVSVRAGEAADGVPDGDHVRLLVSDTGQGIPAGVIARVFDPFFTTKEVGKGTGLGLSQVYGFVAQSGGHVGLRSSEGAGTTVAIHLPRHSTPADGGPDAEPGPAAEPAGPSQPSGTVLVVEDEPAVRRFTSDAVAELGFGVLEADGGPAALALLDGGAEVRLLLTDIVMPDMDGRVLAREAVRRHPALKVLFASGFARDASDPARTGSDPAPFVLAKPFSVEQLAAALRTVLG